MIRTFLSALTRKSALPTNQRRSCRTIQTLAFSRLGNRNHDFKGRNAFRVWPSHFSSSTSSDIPPRDSLNFDVVIVGAGPAGLAAAIRLRQLCQNGGPDLSVCVLEKGAELGAHTLSGNVLETRALDELLPHWQSIGAPVRVPVTNDRFLFLTEHRHVTLPSPHTNLGNYIISLSELVRWLGSQAEAVGVEIFPGFAASELLFSPSGAVEGVATGDKGRGKGGERKETFQRGVEIRGGVTLLAEGTRGSLSEEVIRRFKLRSGKGVQHQTYALGIKEVWEVEEGRHREGEVVHSLGYPLGGRAYGGGFLYHMDSNRVAVGLVVALDYENPFLNPFGEFQKYKLHPEIQKVLEGGNVIQYGARTLNEGGLQSIPELSFPGGALIGCAAGFLNVPKVKGTHTAMKSGMLAAESAYATLAGIGGKGVEGYGDSLRGSWVWEELERARNVRPLASASQPLHYPKPDNKITFDVLTSLYRSNTNHDHDQPTHLRLKDDSVPSSLNWPRYEGPEERYCPAKVYEYLPDEEGTPRLHINAQNCLHCKACDIKDPSQNIVWTVPEGGGGPGYSSM